MSNRRLTRVNELLRREIAAELFRVMNEGGFDMAAVTVTHVITSPNLRHARVLVSVRDHKDDRDEMLNLVKQHRKTIQQHLNKNTMLKYTPQLFFELDESIEKGDHVLSILSELESELPMTDEEEDESTEI